ncbi:alanine racemase [Ketobacter sp.]|uniref:alanine racemase n=1 Tax=Ketobacter sp. TaxID=2083498 RepID=UPI0025C330C5|nr:alanine racemase [Ketobacter sp.]
MGRGTRAVIDLAAMRHNMERVRRHAPHSKVLGVVKADAYGHGLLPVARALAPSSDALGVATFEEGMALKRADLQRPVLLMEGVFNPEQLQAAAEYGLSLVVHQPWQLSMLLEARLPQPVTVWLKVDTGMHRLGMAEHGCALFWQQLQASDNVREVVLMSHLACADEPEHPLNQQQGERFQHLKAAVAARQASLANSAALLDRADFQHEWVRPGLMLYGASPFAGRSAAELGLLPAMHLQSRIISRSMVAAGESVGYGATWTATRATDVAVVAIGYGDGYPRHLGLQAQVLIQGQRCPVVGRVSMDMITVDVSALPGAGPNTPVTLWGPGLPVEDVARWANTVNYELLCQVTGRVERHYQDAGAL